MNITKEYQAASLPARMAILAITLVLTVFLVIPVLLSACVNYGPLIYTFLKQLLEPQPGHKPVAFAVYWMILGTLVVLSHFISEKSKWRLRVFSGLSVLVVLSFSLTPSLPTIVSHIDVSTVFGWQLLMACFVCVCVGFESAIRVIVRVFEFLDWAF